MKFLHLHKLREDIKFFIWDYIDKVHNILRIISIFVVSFTMGVIAYYYGFPQTVSSARICELLIHCSLIFYVLKYFTEAFFSLHTTKFFRKNIGEGVIVFLIILWFVFIKSNLTGGSASGLDATEVSNLSNITMILVQIYFFFMMITELSNVGELFNKFRFGPRGWMISSFLMLILFGTGLLMLPEMTTNGISFINALFTATSASNITGLTVVNTATAFTVKGQFVLMLLMQLGGINIICFATFLSTSYKQNKVHTQSVMKEILNTNYSGSKPLLKTILIYTFIVEAIGFLLFFLHWNHNHFYSDSVSRNLFLSAFHAVAAFCNSGISIVDEGMMNPLFLEDYYTQWVTLVLFTIGSLGFVTLHDINRNIIYREGRKSFWKRLNISSRITIGMSALLVVFGTVCYFLFEYRNSNAGLPLGESCMNSLFMASSARSAGFSTVDTGLLSMPTLLIFMILMFIGSSPSSTGGGIKITTFYILIKSTIATITNKKEVSIAKRAIPGHLIDKSYTVVMLALLLIISSVVIISVSDPQFRLEQILFEVCSALGNVGMSVNICGQLSVVGKSVLVLLMFIGRITILQMAISVTHKAIHNYSLVKTTLSIS